MAKRQYKSPGQLFGVMIASPGDTNAERDAATGAILRWNAHIGKRLNVSLEAIKWETHVTPGLKGRPQGMINEQLLPQADILVAIFRCRAGSPTGIELSGTIEEIRESLRRGIHVVVYFYEGDVSLSSIDPEQLIVLRDFKKEILQQGIVEEFTSKEDLTSKLPHHLTAVVNELAGTPLSVTAGTETKIARKSQDRATSTSRSWIMLGDHFFCAESIRHNSDATAVVVIEPLSGEDEANLADLRPNQFGSKGNVSFAANSDAHVVRVDQATSETTAGKKLWTLSLSIKESGSSSGITEFSVDGVGPDELAQKRAGRILINDPPFVEHRRGYSTDTLLNSAIDGMGHFPVKECVIRSIYQQFHQAPEWNEFARLRAVFLLKMSGTVEHILELSIGTVRGNKVPVKFRGRRGQRYSNSPPATIDINGMCPLA